METFMSGSRRGWRCDSSALLDLIDDEAQWLIRPVIPLKAGGTRSLDNLKMLHSTCQRQFRVAHGNIPARDHRGPASRKGGLNHA